MKQKMIRQLSAKQSEDKNIRHACRETGKDDRMTENVLLQPATVGAWKLSNRVVMAPMTRFRAQPDWTPGELAITYYGQRGSAGVVITEATQVGPDATGYERTPGIWNDAHTNRWRQIAKAIHEGGARAIVQLWHCGRISHVDNMPKGWVPISASSVKPNVTMSTRIAQSGVDIEPPMEMTESDIWRVIDDFRKAASNAKAAGFDGVEIHGANGYLVEQFASSNTNLRTDAWGGSMIKRLRFMEEIIEAIATVFDRSQFGIRLSPYGIFNDIRDEDPAASFRAKLEAAAKAQIGYIHVIRPRVTGDLDLDTEAPKEDVVATARRIFPGTLIVAGGYDLRSGTAEVEQRRADLVAYARPWVANPDLISRWRRGHPLARLDRDTLYVPGAAGYVDYPTADEMGGKSAPPPPEKAPRPKTGFASGRFG
jgi:N-ethylmaleimide reductase